MTNWKKLASKHLIAMATWTNFLGTIWLANNISQNPAAAHGEKWRKFYKRVDRWWCYQNLHVCLRKSIWSSNQDCKTSPPVEEYLQANKSFGTYMCGCIDVDLTQNCRITQIRPRWTSHKNPMPWPNFIFVLWLTNKATILHCVTSQCRL